ADRAEMDSVAQLNEYALKKHLPLDYKVLGHEGPAHRRTFTMRVVLNERAYPEAVGNSKKEAKQRAAKNALECLLESEQQAPADSVRSLTPVSPGLTLPNIQTPTEPTEERLSLKNSHAEINYIGIVNHYCQKKGSSPKYIEVRRCGPPHDPQFFYKLELDDKEYPVGEGKTVKEAKQTAARLAWNDLQEQSDWDSQVSDISGQDASNTHSHSSALASLDLIYSSYFLGKMYVEPSTEPFRHRDIKIRIIPLKSSFTLLSSLQAARDMRTGSSQSGTQSRFESEFDPLECLGSGGFGSVYKARQRLLQKLYAVKIVTCQEKCLREVGTLSDLQHPNIVRYYNSWMEDSAYEGDTSADSSDSAATFLYIQMELCQSKTLTDWINKKNSESPPDSKRREESLSIARQTATGVEYIHREKHIHRDLKPANILFGQDGAVKIGDFGLVTGDDDDGSLMDRTVSHGTPTYMAPEQNTKNYGRKVDIFPLGLIFLELLWKVSSGSERAKPVVLDIIITFLLSFLQKVLIESMLCERPEGRPEASEVRAELGKLSDRKSPLESVTV
uniref:Eukaryotic translation initiation factor 2-alpha kinase 2 n=1 Tax=Mola mola TaxID=94237 RepID=A0A3Q3VR31_MOLML